MKLTRFQTIQFFLFALAVFFPSGTRAQIVPDRTVGTTVTPNVEINGVPSDRIDDGTIRGSNLFHSFQEFNIESGRGAYYTNPEGISNIFTRITGTNLSNINGTLGVLGNANLFFLNPNGIIFGPNARLDLNGSFIGTTASSIKFADGVEFSATNPSASPLLTISVPIGLQFGQNSGDITVQGSGHRSSITPFAPLARSQNPPGLQVGAGQTLSLLGGGVNFSGGIASVNGGGHVEVGSVSNGLVSLNFTPAGWVGNYSAVQQFNDIYLAQQSLLDASGSNGSIQVQGRNITLSEGSALLLQNLGTQPSGNITVHATEALNLTGTTPDGSAGNIIRIENLGRGQAGNIDLSAAQLSLQNGGIISNNTFSPASGGNVTVNVSGAIAVDGFAPTKPILISLISTNTFSSADAGNLTVSADSLRLLNAGSIASTSLGSGQSGAIRVNAQDLIEIAGNNPITLSPSSLGSGAFSSGNANSLFVNTSRLVIRDGGLLGSTTVATGESGSVTVNASESIDIQGRAAGSIAASRIVSNAEILDPATQAAFGLPAIPSGNAGALTINTPSLRITDGAVVTVKNDGPGSAGDVQINADSITLDKQGAITASTASGNGGNIRLNLQAPLLLRHNSLISATAAGTGNGGNLSINAPVFVGLENSDIIANAVQGNGGNIQITTEGIFLSPDSDITASSQLGVSGTVNISILNLNTQNVSILPTNNFVGEAPVIASSCLTQHNGQQRRFVVTGNGGLSETPDNTLMPYFVAPVRTVGQLQGRRNQTPETVNSRQPDRPIQEATGFAFTPDGKVALVVARSEIASPTELTCTN